MDITKYVQCERMFVLGKQGEYGQPLSYDFSDWADEYGATSVAWIIKRPTDTQAYPLASTVDGTISTVVMSATELEHDGQGEIEIFFVTEDNSRISRTLAFYVAPSMLNIGQVPEPWIPYVEAVHQDAQSVLDTKLLIENMSASATVDDNYGTPEVEVTKTEIDDHYNFGFAFANLKGNGITGISKISESGLDKTYRIAMNSGHFDFIVHDGNGIADATSDRHGNQTTCYLVFDDGTTEQFTVYDGVSIASVEKTATSGLTDTYTILYDNGNSDTFTVHNGNGITDITLNNDYTLTITTNEGSYTTGSIRGEKGDTGNFYYATFAIDPATGILTMYYDTNYSGAMFSLVNGYLEVTV